MKKLILIALFCLFSHAEDAQRQNDIQKQLEAYMNLLDELSPSETSLLVQNLAVLYLPANVNETLMLKSIKAQDTTLLGEFVMSQKNDKTWLENSVKNELCINKIFAKVLQKDIVMKGNFTGVGPNFSIIVDKKFCDLK